MLPENALVEYESQSLLWNEKTLWQEAGGSQHLLGPGNQLASRSPADLWDCAFGCALAQLPLLEILLGTRGKASETLLEGLGGIIVAI